MNLFLNLLFRKVFEEKLFLHLTKAAFGAILSLLYGEVLKWSKRRDSKSRRALTRRVGSNPTFSANKKRTFVYRQRCVF